MFSCLPISMYNLSKPGTQYFCADDVSDISFSHLRKVLMELCRRKWPTLELGPLQTWRKRDILEEFLRRSLAGRSAAESAPTPADCTGSGLSTKQHGEAATFLTGVEMMADGTLGLTADSVGGIVSADGGGGGGGGGGHRRRGAPLGLVLYPSMIESILSR